MLRVRFFPFLMILGLALQLGITSETSPANAELSAPSPRLGEGRLHPGEAKQLCLADPSGDAGRMENVRVERGLAQKLPAKPEGWILAGWGWVRKARLTGDPGFYVNVEGCVDAALATSPENAGALTLRALALMSGHRFAEAQKEAEKVLRQDPHNPIALGTLSDALLEQGQFDQAAAAAQRGADVKPESSTYARASYLRWLAGDREGAKRFIRSALEGRDASDPEPAAWCFVEAAKIFWHEADYAGADTILAEALRWVPDYPAALVARGRVALSQAQPRQAVEYLEKAYHSQPLPETAWLLADARELLGDSEGAKREQARVVQAGNRSDRLTLALFYATKNRDHEEALRLIETERATRGGPHVEDTYAWALYRAGRVDEARRASNRALRLGTPDARLLYHAGAIQLAAGVTAGRTLIEKALALNPKFDLTGAAEARALIAAASAATTPPRLGTTAKTRSRASSGSSASSANRARRNS